MPASIDGGEKLMAAQPGTTSAEIIPSGGQLPAMPLEEWESTKDTMHLWIQMVGKVKLALTPLKNQWWNVPLYLDARGLTTRPLRHGESSFRIDFDFVEHRLNLVTDQGPPTGFVLADGLSVASFYERLVGLLAAAGIEVPIRPEPFGVPMTTPFSEDREHASYDAAAAERYWRVLDWAYWVFEGFAGWFSGKASPVQIYWHSLDIAYTRFSGRDAPPDTDADAVNREAYAQELISFGFWAGDRIMRFPAFYSYTAPEPKRLTEQPLEPNAARWEEAYGGHLAILPYEDLRKSDDPQRELLGFLESAYRAGAASAAWPADAFRSNWSPRPGELVVLRGH
jgi:uncharacterized protein DUF5996